MKLETGEQRFGDSEATEHPVARQARKEWKNLAKMWSRKKILEPASSQGIEAGNTHMGDPRLRRYLARISLFGRGLGICLLLIVSTRLVAAVDLYVATTGSDTNPGTITAPYKTLSQAQLSVRALLPTAAGPVNVWVRAGTYYLGQPLIFGPQDSGSSTAPVTYSAYSGETVTLSGALKLNPIWSPYSGNILVANIGTGLDFDMLFANGTLQTLARYPNYDSGTTILNGYASDCISPARAANWKNPTTGLVRGLHGSLWGGNSFKISGLDSGGNPILQWMGDNNRDDSLHPTYRLVENIFEELDAPGEWFYDKTAGNLYFYPPQGVNPVTATFEAAVLPELVEIIGTNNATPVKYLTFNSFIFTHTHRTLFIGPYEGLMRGDWAVVRAGAFFLQNAENVTIQNSQFNTVGGNAIFISGYNRNHLITQNQFLENGATCVDVVGLMSATRYPSTWANQHTDIQDTTPGPLTPDYPQYITITYNHMYHMGRFEKESAGVNISVADSITVGHNTIHGSPRSGININDGTFGGHIIEYNDLFDCVEETGDHGPFNSWGRDRYWSYPVYDTNGDYGIQKQPYAFLDAWKTTIIRNNRLDYTTSSTWGIDLDDGSSNYDIYNNLCLNTGFKLRDGFGRKVHNNIVINQQGNLQCWYDECSDQVYNNIIVSAAPWSLTSGLTVTTMPAKQATIDYNLFYNNGNSVSLPFTGWTTTLGYDAHSLTADPLFNNPATLDYSVQTGSPALSVGFVNFPMNQFGDPGSPTPVPLIGNGGSAVTPDPEPFLGATITSIYSPTIQSVTGISDVNGAYFDTLPTGSYAANQGFQLNDVIRSINGTTVTTKLSFWAIYNSCEPGTVINLTLQRNQTSQSFNFIKPGGAEELNDTAGVVFTGSQWYSQATTGAYNSDIHATTNNGDSFSFTFYGTGVSLLSETYSDEGTVSVYIDNVLDQTVDCSSSSRAYQQVVYNKSGLTFGLHTVKAVKVNASFMILDSIIVQSPLAPNLLSVASVQSHAGTNYGIGLPLTGDQGIECRIINGSLQIVFTFASPITSGTAQVTDGTAEVASTSFSGDTMTVNLTGVTNAQNITLDVTGLNETSGSAETTFGVLRGDVNGDGVVNILDLGQIRMHTGQTVGADNFQYDINEDGTINILDLGQDRLNTGTSLP